MNTEETTEAPQQDIRQILACAADAGLLTISQLRGLLHIAEEQQALTADVAEAAGLKAVTVGPMIKRFSELGLVEKGTFRKTRLSCYELTEYGERMVKWILTGESGEEAEGEEAAGGGTVIPMRPNTWKEAA